MVSLSPTDTDTKVSNSMQMANGLNTNMSTIRKVVAVASLLFFAGGLIGAFLFTPQGSFLFWGLIGGSCTSFSVLAIIVIQSCLKNRSHTQSDPVLIQSSVSHSPHESASAKKNNTISEYFMGGGIIQKRAYQFIVLPLLCTIYDFLTDGNEHYDQQNAANIIHRIEGKIFNPSHFLHFLNTSYKDRPSNLNSLEGCLWKCFYYLKTINDKNASINRKKFNYWLQMAKESPEYQANIKAYNSIESEVDAKKAYPLIALVMQIANAMFSKVYLHTLADEAVIRILEEGFTRESKKFTYWKGDVELKPALIADFNAIDTVPATQKSGGLAFNIVNKLKGHFNINFDPVNSNNYISVLWKDLYRAGAHIYDVEWLRFGTPTAETFNNPHVIAQFHFFLNTCEKEKKIVVCFQHQNYRKKPSMGGNESFRLQKLLELNGFYEKAYFFALPMDNDFFHQRGEFKNALEDANKFITEFFAVFIHEDRGFYIPEKIEGLGLEYQAAIKDIIHSVHKIFFTDKTTLSPEERTYFQILTYLFIEDYFTTALGLYHYNHSSKDVPLEKTIYCISQCKDAQDRAMVILALQFYKRMIVMGRDKDPEYIRQLRVLIHHAALFIKGDKMHRTRAKLLINILEFIQKISTTSKDQLIKYTFNHTVNNQLLKIILDKSFIEWTPNQSIDPLPYEASSLEEYKRLIQCESGKEHYLPISNFASICYKNEIPQSLNDKGILAQFLKDIERQEYMIEGKRPSLEIDAKASYLSYKNLSQLYLDDKLTQKEFHHLDKEMLANIKTILIDNKWKSLEEIRDTLKDLKISGEELERIADIHQNNPYRNAEDIFSLKKELKKLQLSDDTINEIYNLYLQYGGSIHYEFNVKLKKLLSKWENENLTCVINKIIYHLKANQYYSYIYKNCGKAEALSAQLLGYSDQRVLSDMTQVIYQRYNAIYEKDSYDQTIDIQAFQREVADHIQPNTTYNIYFKTGCPVITVRQLWDIRQTDDQKTFLYSLKSQLSFEVQKGQAVITWTSPDKEMQNLYEPLPETPFSQICNT